MDILHLPIVSRKKVSVDAYEVRFRLSSPFLFRPGQYVRITIPKLLKPDTKGNYRDFSIASSPTDGKEIAIVTRESDSGFKRSLLGLPEGTQVKITGPFGNLALPDDTTSPIVFVAGGIGITPYLSMIRYLSQKHAVHGPITLLYGNRDAESSVYLDELEDLQKTDAAFALKSHFGIIDQAFIKENVPDIEGAHWFVAGPPKMVSEVKTILFGFGVPEARLHTEEFLGYESGTSVRGWVAETIRSSEPSAEMTQEDLDALMQALDNSAIVSKTDAEGTILYVNNKFVEVSKYARNELIGQNHRLLKSGHHSTEFYENLWETISNGKIWRGEIKNQAKDGTYYWVDSSISPIMGDEGKPVYYISVRFLITERKEFEEHIIQISKELEASNKELEAFSYSVSHDLRAPLRAIDGFAKILLEDFGPKLDDEGKRVIAKISGNAQMMGRLIDDLLSFSRLGRQEVKDERVNMDEMVAGIIHELERAEPDRKVRFDVHPLPEATGDPILIRQVWTNLLSNAMKFTRKTAQPTIEVGGSSPEKDLTAYFVKDNGAGFDMKYANKLFGVFQRLHTNEEFEGTGVGLAIVKRIVTRHHGTIVAEGEVDKGATFTFTLPLQQLKPNPRHE